jgi:hypothetical protein
MRQSDDISFTETSLLGTNILVHFQICFVNFLEKLSGALLPIDQVVYISKCDAAVAKDNQDVNGSTLGLYNKGFGSLFILIYCFQP